MPRPGSPKSARRGSTLPEYALILAFMVIMLFGTITWFSGTLSNFITGFGMMVGNAVQSSNPGQAGTPGTGPGLPPPPATP